MKHVALLIGISAIFSCLSLAQQEGTLLGSVVSSNGLPLSDVMVTLTSPESIHAKIEARTNRDGKYIFYRVMHGNWRMVFGKDGYQSVKLDVSLSAGSRVMNNLTLAAGESLEPIDHTKPNLSLDSSDYGFSYVLNSRMYKDLPLSVSLWDSLNLLPGTNDGSVLGSVQTVTNQSNIDGIETFDPFTGKPLASVITPLTRQIKFTFFGAPIDKSAFSGSSANLISKSGGRNWSAGIKFQYRDPAWQSQDGNNYSDYSFELPDVSANRLYSLGVGGPIVKDKIWILTSWTSIKDIYNRTLADQTISHASNKTHLFAKLSGAYGNMNNWWMTVISDVSDSDSFNFNNPWRQHVQGSLFKNSKDLFWISLRNIYSLTDRIAITASYRNQTYASDVSPLYQGESKYDLIQERYLPASQQSFSQTQKSRMDLLTLKGHLLSGSSFSTHDWLIGVEAERISTDYRKQDLQSGTYLNGVGYQLYDYGSIDAGQNIMRLTGYFGDTWAVNEKLMINYGLRSDTYDYSAANPAGAPAGEEKFVSLGSTSYRLNLIFDVFANGQTVVRGSAGRFINNPLVGNYTSLVTRVPATGVYQGKYFYPYSGSDSWRFLEWQRQKQTTVSEDLKNPYTDGFSVGLDQVLNERYVARLNFTWKKDVNIIGFMDPTIYYYGSNTKYSVGEYQYLGAYYSIIRPGDTAIISNASEGDPGVLMEPYRKYWGISASIERSWQNNWAITASYTFNRTEGTVSQLPQAAYGNVILSDPNASVNGIGRLELERPHVLKFSGTVKLPLDIMLSSIAFIQQGTPWTNYVMPGDYSIRFQPNEGENRFDWQSNIDIRIEKLFRMGRVNLGFYLDVFNLLNSDAIIDYRSFILGSNDYLQPAAAMDPRSWLVATRITF